METDLPNKFHNAHQKRSCDGRLDTQSFSYYSKLPCSFLKMYFCLYYDRTELTGSEVGERGWDRERSSSQDSILGRPWRNGAVCRRAAHEDISAEANNTILSFTASLSGLCASLMVLYLCHSLSPSALCFSALIWFSCNHYLISPHLCLV